MPISSKSAARYRRLSVERLERRDVLSADLGFGHLGAGAPVAVQPTQHFDFAITGTQVFYSPLGLPTEMKGDCYMPGPGGASLGTIGTYDETLQPIFAPVGPGGSPAFVGATGVCTFDFDLSLAGGCSITIGSIVADDTAMITGALPDGTILVQSTSTPIVSASGICAGMTGTFNAQSQVAMGASFSMHTDVQFNVQDCYNVNLEGALTMLATVNSATTAWQATAPANQPQHHVGYGVDCSTDRDAVVDAVFSSGDHGLWDTGFRS